MATVLVIGSGGREHAIAWTLAKSEKVRSVIVAPGNGGTGVECNTKFTQVPSDYPGLSDYLQLAEWCRANAVGMVVVGPEDPLADGLADCLSGQGIKCFGPSQAAAQIEASKSFAKHLMDKYNIPTAVWKSFTDAESAKRFIEQCAWDGYVVKADGLAAGKGVVVASDRQHAMAAVDDIMTNRKFGSSCGQTIIVEEFLPGYEVSCLAFTDGHSVRCMPPSQDHKRLLDADRGPNTGGMGAYCPCPLVDKAVLAQLHDIMQCTVTAMREEGCPFTGVLYGGFMISPSGPKVLEFNCRFGDPETQAILPLLTSDLYDVMLSCVEGKLSKQAVTFDLSRSCAAVVLVSGGYPEKYKKGLEIAGLDGLPPDHITVFHAGTTKKPDCCQLVTNGGRVLTLASVQSSLRAAINCCMNAATQVSFEGVFFRKDIAKAALLPADPKPQHTSQTNGHGLSYADCGVSITAGNSLVDNIAPLCKATSRAGCLGAVGMFGSVFDLKLTEFTDPLLVSGTDGVGTKLMLALACQKHDTIGQDLVAMCVNDILCHGASPLYFLDYFATGKLDVQVAAQVVGGIASACQLAGCALVGGETAEMPGMYSDSKYDLAGFCVGAVERDRYLPCVHAIREGDVVLGLPSNGLHSNGFSLVRKVVERSNLAYTDVCPYDSSQTLGEALLAPTHIYVKQVLKALSSGNVKAISHITGGGLVENIPRVLPAELSVSLDASRWAVPPVFGWLQHLGHISDTEMSRTFNCGIGLTLIISPEHVDSVCRQIKDAIPIGHVCRPSTNDDCRVVISNLSRSLQLSWTGPSAPTLTSSPKIKVGVLISGTGTNLQALIDSCQQAGSVCDIALVISNVEGVLGLSRAQQAGIPTKVISHKLFKSREEFDEQLTFALDAAGIELVCLAGFMRILSAKFVSRWRGRLLNIHPSLLPSFKGVNAHEQALAAGVKLSGCTVHFVVEEVDSGEILEQEVVPVLEGDSVHTLQERVKTGEHKAYPRAMQNVAKKFLADRNL